MRKAKKFVLNTIILTASSLLLRTISVSFMVYVSSKIGQEGMGIFQLIMSIYMFGITLATSGIGITTTRLVAEELAVGSHSGIKSAVRKCLAYSVICSLLTCLLIYLSSDFISNIWLHDKISTMPVNVLALSLPFLAISSVIRGYFTAVRRIIKSTSAQILDQFIQIGVTVYAINLIAPKGLEYACLALVLGGVISEVLSCLYLFVLYLFDKRKFKNKTEVDPNISKRMFGIAVPIALNSYIRSGLSTYKQMIIPQKLEKSGMSTAQAISQYGIIHGMVMPILMFPSALLSAFSSLLIPEITQLYVQKNNNSICYIMSRIFKITLIFSIGVSGVLFAYSKELSMQIYQNTEPAIFIQLLAPLILVMYFDDIVDAILKGLNEQVSVVGINIFDTIVSIFLIIFLVPKFGIMGYIVVIFISNLLNGILSMIKLIKVSKVEIHIIRWVLIPIISILISILFSKILIRENLFLSITAVALIYFIFLYAFQCISSKDFKL